MGYYSERLRQRLESMTPEHKKVLWDKYSYLNEYGPIVNGYTEFFYYGEDIPCTPVLVPEEVFSIKGDSFRFAA